MGRSRKYKNFDRNFKFDDMQESWNSQATGYKPTTHTPTKATEPVLPLTKINWKGKVVIPKRISDLFDFLHAKVGAREWSGWLLYREEGNFGADGYTVTIEDFCLMDIGTAGGTDFRTISPNDDHFLKHYIPRMMASEGKLVYGLCHTHHNMATFFSGTDEQELRDQAQVFSKFLSLITNFKNDYKARFSFVGEKKTSYGGNQFIEFNTEVTEKCIYYFDLDVVTEIPSLGISQLHLDRYEEVATKTKYSTSHYYSTGKVHTTTNPTTTVATKPYWEKDEEDVWGEPYYTTTAKSLDVDFSYNLKDDQKTLSIMKADLAQMWAIYSTNYLGKYITPDYASFNRDKYALDKVEDMLTGLMISYHNEIPANVQAMKDFLAEIKSKNLLGKFTYLLMWYRYEYAATEFSYLSQDETNQWSEWITYIGSIREKTHQVV